MNLKELLTKEYLYEEYIVKNKTIKFIANELGIKCLTSVSYYIKKYDLHKSSSQKYDDILTEVYLIDNYVIQKKSIKEICKEIKTPSKKVVVARLKKFNITREDRHHSKSKLAFYNRRKKHPIISGVYFNNIKHGAKTRNLEFNITIDEAYDIFLNQDSKCALSGVDLCFVDCYAKNRLQQTASLDRIDSSLGYNISNVQWVHKNINEMKLDLSNNKFIDICENVAFHIDELDLGIVYLYNKIPNRYINGIKYRAKSKNLEFNITEKYLFELLVNQNYKCSLSGVLLTLSNNRQTASLDRIDSSKGYIQGNVQWVEKTVNKMKWSSSQEDFIKMCKLIAENNKDL